MIKRTKENFTQGSQSDINRFLVISEDCRGYIESVIERIHELGLTNDEQCDFDVFASDIQYEIVSFYFSTGGSITFKKNHIDFQGGKYYYDLEYTQHNLQLCYHEIIEFLGHNNEIEATAVTSSPYFLQSS